MRLWRRVALWQLPVLRGGAAPESTSIATVCYTVGMETYRSKFAEVLSVISDQDELARASAAARVYLHRVPGQRPSDAARTIVARWRAGRLDTWAEIQRDANPGPLIPYTDGELRSFR